MGDIEQFVPADSEPDVLTAGDLRAAVGDHVSDEAFEEGIDCLRSMQSRVNYPSRRYGAPIRRVGAGTVEPLFPPCHYVRSAPDEDGP